MKTCMAPDANPRQPDFAPPAGACDAHCHVFGPADRFPYHPARSYTPPDAPKERLAALHALLGIERAVIVQASCHGIDNTAMLDAIAASNGRYRGIAIVDDGFGVEDFAALDAGGVRGVRFNFVGHLGGAPDFTVFERVVERISPLGWHLVLHLDAGDIVTFADRFRALSLPIVIDHMGRVKTADGLDQKPFAMLLDFLDNENVWVKICGAERISSAGPPFADAVPFARALIDKAPDRVLWGTDFPHPNIARHMPNDGDLVDLVPLFAPDPEMQRRLLVDNPARLYGFEEP
jgi:2-pyrone-4,6-dicarboxylate lactonase